MRTTAEQHGALTVLSPSGPLTFESRGAFEEASERTATSTAGRMAVDMAAVSWVDGEGMEALVGFSERLERIGHPARLIRVNATVREALEIVGLIGQFRVFESSAEAARDLP